MKTESFRHLWPWSHPTAVIAALLLAAANLTAGPVVDTLTGGPYQFNPNFSGYTDGNTAAVAQFHTPIGLALDSLGNYLFVADRDNNAVRELDLAGNFTFTFADSLMGIDKPVGVALDGAGNVYVLNRGNGNNGTVLEFDSFGDPLGTSAVGLVNANGIALDSQANIYLTVSNNTVIKISPLGVQSTVATVNVANTVLQGITVMSGGNLAVCDSGRHGVLLINLASNAVSNLTGFNGAGDHFGTKAFTKFNQPYGVAAAGGGILIVTDYGNNRVKVVDALGTVTNLYGVSSNFWVTGSGTFPGWWDGTVARGDVNYNELGTVESRLPAGVIFTSSGDIYTTEDYYHLIRKVIGAGLPQPPPPAPTTAPTIISVITSLGQVSLTWSTVSGATSYNVKRSPSSGGPYTIIANTTPTTNTDNTVTGGTTYYYVVSGVNAGGEGPNSAEVSARPPLPPVPDPHIGWVSYPPPLELSVFNEGSSFVFNDDVDIVIVGTSGSQTFYTFGPTSSGIPDPTTNSVSAPLGYEDGLSKLEVASKTVATILPDLTIKAVGVKNDGSPNSAIVSARFQFVVGNPKVVGNNAAQFTVFDVTPGAELWYTTDGSSPTNAAPSQLAGTIVGTNGITLSLGLPASGDLTFNIRGFKANYQPSSTVTILFSVTNFIPNRITFGLTNGEPSSSFLARPGQFFYAPVTLQLQPGGDTMYSLQFNVAVTNGLVNTNTGIRPPDIQNGAGIDFFSMLVSLVPKEHTPDHNPPPLFDWYLTIPPFLLGSVSNEVGGSIFVNTNNNLLGVGWLYRPAFEYIVKDTNGTYFLDFDTTKHDLITYSIAHDTLFNKANGTVVVGAYSFQVPPTASLGDKYFIQLGSPSATRDGVGAPGSSVYIRPPSTSQAVTVGTPFYVVGDAAPFRWLDAGDFGDTNLNNADVMQVFQTAILGLDVPPANSDLFSAMDSCGTLGTYDSANGYYVNSGPMSPGQIQAMFDGSDLTINQVAFGDDPPNLDVCDVFVTFRRSLDPSLFWFRRFWTNGQFVAVTNANLAFNSNSPSAFSASSPALKDSNPITTYQQSSVLFTAGDAVVSAGQTIQIPINAKILGSYPLRVLGLNITVSPLEGSPSLTQPIQFSPAPGLGQPTIAVSKHAANFSGAWLNNTVPGLSSNASLGTLTITLPTNATAASAYAIHFDHVSASPNGIAPFPKQTQTGLITLSDRSTSSWNDGIPDSWRLRYFGTVNNLLSAASADADGDGVNNLQEFKAGTNPNDASSVFRLGMKRGQAKDIGVHWPSVLNKQYVIERATDLYSPAWTAIATNIGTGWDMELHDTNGGGNRFYRVRVLP